MVPRFYAPTLAPTSTEVALPPDEALHAIRVLRLQPGAAVRVFDGRGLERAATVLRITKTAAVVTAGTAVETAPEVPARIVLAQALLKSDKFDDIVRDATMLGVAGIRPLATEHVDVPALATRDGGRVDRWRRIAVASVKQCGRAVVPEVTPVSSLATCLAADSSALRLMLGEPSLGSTGCSLRELAPSIAGAGTVLLLVGPEGGWAEAEVTLARAEGCRLVSLGRRTLRADAAPIVALSVLLHLLDEL